MLSFERLVTEPEDSLQRVVQFYGLPEMAEYVLPHSNSQDCDHKVEVISCESRAVLQRLYAEWGDILIRGLNNDRKSGLSPPQEPTFSGFNFEVPCEDKERAVGIHWNVGDGKSGKSHKHSGKRP